MCLGHCLNESKKTILGGFNSEKARTLDDSGDVGQRRGIGGVSLDELDSDSLFGKAN